jgi:hypothetical protein
MDELVQNNSAKITRAVHGNEWPILGLGNEVSEC